MRLRSYLLRGLKSADTCRRLVVDLLLCLREFSTRHAMCLMSFLFLSLEKYGVRGYEVNSMI